MNDNGTTTITPTADDLTIMRDALLEAKRRVDLLRTLAAILSARVYQWATLALVAAGFGVYLYAPTWPRLAGVVAFTLLAHVHTYWRERHDA